MLGTAVQLLLPSAHRLVVELTTLLLQLVITHVKCVPPHRVVSHSHLVCSCKWVLVLINMVVLVVVRVPGWINSVTTKDCSFRVIVVIHATLSVLVSVSIGCIVCVYIVRVLEGTWRIL